MNTTLPNEHYPRKASPKAQMVKDNALKMPFVFPS